MNKVVTTVLCVAGFLAAIRVGVSVQRSSFMQNRILGNDGFSYKFEYQVSLRSKQSSNNTHICTGSILANNWILTSARCVSGYQPHEIAAKYGGNQNISASGLSANIAEIIIHPKYSSQFMENDIAMLRTKSNLIFNQKRTKKRFASPINLPKMPTIHDEFSIVSGWGVKNVSDLFFLFLFCHFVQISRRRNSLSHISFHFIL